MVGVITLYRANINCLNDNLRTHYKGWLTEEERARLASITTTKASDCFLLSRAIVRHRISLLLDRPPQAISLQITPEGKPILESSSKYSSYIHFNITHKSDQVVVGFSTSAIGVDLESVPDKDKLKIAERFYSSEELNELEHFTGGERNHYFTKLWTLKEAEIKRHSLTLARNIKHFAFSIKGQRIYMEGAKKSGYLSLWCWPGLISTASYLATSAPVNLPELPVFYSGLPLEGFEKEYPQFVAQGLVRAG